MKRTTTTVETSRWDEETQKWVPEARTITSKTDENEPAPVAPYVPYVPHVPYRPYWHQPSIVTYTNGVSTSDLSTKIMNQQAQHMALTGL